MKINSNTNRDGSTEALSGSKQMVETIAQMMSADKRPNFHEWWRDSGEWFDKDHTTKKDSERLKMVLGDNYLKNGFCYWNSQMTAHFGDEYQYYEGYAVGEAKIPLEHAWLVKDGKVVDPTWGKKGFDYFGVAIPHVYVRKQVEKTGQANDLLGRYWWDKKQDKKPKGKKKISGYKIL